MSIMSYFRLYHAVLAVLSVLAYLTAEMGIVHAWLGYGVAIVIVGRLLWALSGERQLGLSRFYPSFEGLDIGNILKHPAISRTLLLGIATTLITVTVTGILADRGRAIGLASTQFVTTAYAEEEGEEEDFENEQGEREEEGFLMEVHELSGNLLIFFVVAHIAYLFLFKRPLATYMLFLSRPKKKA